VRSGAPPSGIVLDFPGTDRVEVDAVSWTRKEARSTVAAAGITQLSLTGADRSFDAAGAERARRLRSRLPGVPPLLICEPGKHGTADRLGVAANGLAGLPLEGFGETVKLFTPRSEPDASPVCLVVSRVRRRLPAAAQGRPVGRSASCCSACGGLRRVSLVGCRRETLPLPAQWQISPSGQPRFRGRTSVGLGRSRCRASFGLVVHRNSVTAVPLHRDDDGRARHAKPHKQWPEREGGRWSDTES